MNKEDLRKRIIEELGIDEENISNYENDITLISKQIGNHNVLAKGDSAYNKNISYSIIETIVGEIDTYYIVNLE